MEEDVSGRDAGEKNIHGTCVHIEKEESMRLRNVVIGCGLSLILSGCAITPAEQRLDDMAARWEQRKKQPVEVIAKGTYEEVFDVLYGRWQVVTGSKGVGNAVVLQRLKHPATKTAEIRALWTNALFESRLEAFIKIAQLTEDTCSVKLYNNNGEMKLSPDSGILKWLNDEGMLISPVL